MPQYMITYVGTPKPPATPREGQLHMEKYKEWLSSLGRAVLSPANPIKNTSTINPDGSVNEGGISTMTGFTVIQVESNEAALEFAKACPYLEIGGSLEVSELIEMSV